MLNVECHGVSVYDATIKLREYFIAHAGIDLHGSVISVRVIEYENGSRMSIAQISREARLDRGCELVHINLSVPLNLDDAQESALTRFQDIYQGHFVHSGYRLPPARLMEPFMWADGFYFEPLTFRIKYKILKLRGET